MNATPECSECGGLGDQTKPKVHADDCTLKPQPRKIRRASFTLSWSFDGTKQVRVTIEENRKEGTTMMIIRPFRRRKTVAVPLREVAERMAWKAAGANKLKRRRRRV